MIINFNPRHGAEYHGIEGGFRFPYGVYTPPAYGFPEVQQDFISLNAKINSIIAKLPADFIAGSFNDLSLEEKHGNGSWETAVGFASPSDVKCGGGGGGGVGTTIQRPDIWKPEEKLKLIDDIKKIYKMINELSSLQSTGLQNVKKNIDAMRNSLLKLIKEEIALLVSLKKTISEQQQQQQPERSLEPINLLIAKWDSLSESIQKPVDFSSLDSKLDELAKIMVKSLSNKALEELVHAE